ncbi:MAG: gamma-glutamyltranspeptidase/glutathione hydrolase [Myxococcota bacterium]|jgi:gamma-glutamyltranspeptidase/glutathione hydrolase
MLRMGGNAVDAAIASLMMAAVSEPMLTGPGGAGLAMVRFGGSVVVCDMFTDMPGLGRTPGRAPTMDAVHLDYGPTQQRFDVGPGAVATLGIPAGVMALHQRFGSLPMTTLVGPAVEAAEQGVVIQPGLARILAALTPIVGRSPGLSSLIAPDGHMPVAGEIHRNPGLAETFRQFAVEGDALFRTGRVAGAILETLGDDSLLSADDLSAYSARFRRPVRYRYRNATVWVPGVPSVAGLLVLQALRELEDCGPMPPALGADQIRLMTAAMARADRSRGARFNRSVFLPGFEEGFLTALCPEEEGEEWLHMPLPDPSTGHTTHISTVDSDGNAVGITTSLGESCGMVAGDTGVILNNFLGEADVNPEGVTRSPGQRLMTMCCPTLLEVDGQVAVMGSGGSSRIRSAVLHGIVYLADHRMSPSEAADAPRSHVDGPVTSIELDGRPEGTRETLADVMDDVHWFEGPNMFFGGLNIAGKRGDEFVGAGDARRSGCFRIA